jgi:hypothetical protein
MSKSRHVCIELERELCYCRLRLLHAALHDSWCSCRWRLQRTACVHDGVVSLCFGGTSPSRRGAVQRRSEVMVTVTATVTRGVDESAPSSVRWRFDELVDLRRNSKQDVYKSCINVPGCRSR